MKTSFALLFCLLLVACIDQNPNDQSRTTDLIENNTVVTDKPMDYITKDTVYVPIYSDVYSRTKDIRFPLTATLSVRNTSFGDTIIINLIDYYNTEGQLVHKYLTDPIYLNPMATLDYVVDEEDASGGTGANFIVIWSSKAEAQPLIQSVMISTNGQQGVAFTTDGVSIRKKDGL